ncbi:MAG: hypothetical protein B0W54_01005 [Cellvibrio sp. 79]|nr:MAG: hypothetical protein B0W54_01005 [Cellvibrio sp. 79]
MMSQLLQRPGKLALTIGLLIPLIAGCTTSQAVDRTSYSTTAAQASFSEAQLDSLLAPVALYPDTVLSHVLIASTYPLEVVEADRWARNNTRYKGDDAVNAVDSRDWDPSVKALVAFPDILRRMSEDLDWTQQLGDAFLADEERVMDSVQKLRNRAYASGHLDKVDHVRVIREEKTIVIEPSVERVVYVPAYDTRVVYGNWWWPDYPPVYWNYPSSYVFVSGFYWGPRVYIGPRFYFSGCHWRDRRVYVVDRHHHHGHRFYDSRSVVRHVDATRWSHNPTHRRGVAYYDNRTRERFNSPRESFRESQNYRANLRDDGDRVRGDNRVRTNTNIAPNQARDQRQNRSDEFQQRLQRRQAGQITTPADRTINNGNERPQARAEQLRERMNTRTNERNLGTLRNDGQNATTNPRWNSGNREQNGQENRGNIRQSESRTPQERLNPQRIERIQTPRYERPQIQREERQTQREERQIQRTESRIEQPRVEQRIERFEQPRTEQRAERMERFRESGGGSREGRASNERSEIRGGRER